MDFRAFGLHPEFDMTFELTQTPAQIGQTLTAFPLALHADPVVADACQQMPVLQGRFDMYRGGL